MKDQLISNIAKLIDDYEYQTGNKIIVGCYLTFNDDNFNSVFEFNGENFVKTDGPLTIGGDDD